jgi:hypothetical protein
MSKKPVVGKRQKPTPTQGAVAEDGQLARSSVPTEAARAAALQAELDEQNRWRRQITIGV